jgi:hypothetical protein
MKRSFDIMCTLVFVLGILVGILMHGHCSWNDIFVLVIAALVFHTVRTMSIQRIVRFIVAKKG